MAAVAQRIQVNPNDHSQSMTLWSSGRITARGGALDVLRFCAAMAVPPSSVAGTEASAPPIFPKGVRAVPRMTVFDIAL